jgi:hypothetical protein
LQKPHGELPCDEKLDKSMIEFAKNTFVKKCPNCSIITEKSSGCNHITCSKCNYQWCWLCNGKYSNEHYLEGKCKGYQFYRPNNENDIKLAFEGKVVLRESQRQEDLNDFDNWEPEHDLPPIDRQIRHRNVERNNSFGKSLLVFCIYLISGHLFFSFAKIPNSFDKSEFTGFFIFLCFIFSVTAYFFFIFYINIIMLIFYLKSEGFHSFIAQCLNIYHHPNIEGIYFKTIFLLYNIFFGGFFHILYLVRCWFEDIRINAFYSFMKRLIYIMISIIYTLQLFLFQLVINIVILLLFIAKDKYNFMDNIIIKSKKALHLSKIGEF